MTPTREEILEWRSRHMGELYAAFTAKTEETQPKESRMSDEPPQEPEVPRSTRALAAALMQTPTAGPTPDPDDSKEPDALAAAVAAQLKRKDNRGRAHLGLLPNQEEE